MKKRKKRMHPLMRLRKIINGCEEQIATVEWWNRNRTDAPPLDCEVERILLAKAIECRSAWGDPERYTRLSGEMVKYISRAVKEDHA